MVIIHAYTEEQQREAFAHPLCVPGSDATTMAPTGPLAGADLPRRLHVGGVVPALLRPAGAAADPARRRSTGSPFTGRADRPRDRGALRAGAHADVVVFDPRAFREQGTTFDPSRLATGMDTVIVNGAVTLSDGELTGARKGQVLRRQ